MQSFRLSAVTSIFMLGIICLIFAHPVLATTLETSDTFSSSSEDLDFQYFDTSLGTLNSVTITFETNVLSDAFTLTNNTGSDATGTMAYEVSVALTGDSSAPSLWDSTDSYHIGSGADALVSSNTLSYNLAKGTLMHFDFEYADSTTGDAAAIDQYEGSGNFTLNVSVSVDKSVTGGAVLISEPASAYEGTVKITYNYTPSGEAPVPEPGTIILLGLGLAGLARAGRRRMKQ